MNAEVNGQIGTLIDCTYGRYAEIRNKQLYFIMTAAVSKRAWLDRTLEGFRGFASCLPGAKEKGVIYGSGAWNIGDIKGSAAMSQAYELGKSAQGGGDCARPFHHIGPPPRINPPALGLTLPGHSNYCSYFPSGWINQRRLAKFYPSRLRSVRRTP